MPTKNVINDAVRAGGRGVEPDTVLIVRPHSVLRAATRWRRTMVDDGPPSPAAPVAPAAAAAAADVFPHRDERTVFVLSGGDRTLEFAGRGKGERGEEKLINNRDLLEGLWACCSLVARTHPCGWRVCEGSIRH